MATGTKYQQLVEDVHHGAHDWSSDTFSWALTNTAPNAATHAILSDITEIGDGNGYTSGSHNPTLSSSGQTSGTYKAVFGDVTITASGGTIGPFRYAVFYNNTPSSPLNPLVASWDYGSSITLQDGESFLLDADPTNGIYQSS